MTRKVVLRKICLHCADAAGLIFCYLMQWHSYINCDLRFQIHFGGHCTNIVNTCQNTYQPIHQIKRKKINTYIAKIQGLLRAGLVTVVSDTYEMRRTEAHTHSMRAGQLEFWLSWCPLGYSTPLFYNHKQQVELQWLGL